MNSVFPKTITTIIFPLKEKEHVYKISDDYKEIIDKFNKDEPYGVNYFNCYYNDKNLIINVLENNACIYGVMICALEFINRNLYNSKNDFKFGDFKFKDNDRTTLYVEYLE